MKSSASVGKWVASSHAGPEEAQLTEVIVQSPYCTPYIYDKRYWYINQSAEKGISRSIIMTLKKKKSDTRV